MQIVKQKQATRIDATSTTLIEEYRMEEQAISGATSIITGRYPLSGYAVNTVSKEIALVISGDGLVGTPEKKIPIVIGDCIYIDAKEKFFWEGNMALFIVCAPAFNQNQHKISS